MAGAFFGGLWAQQTPKRVNLFHFSIFSPLLQFILLHSLTLFFILSSCMYFSTKLIFSMNSLYSVILGIFYPFSVDSLHMVFHPLFSKQVNNFPTLCLPVRPSSQHNLQFHFDWQNSVDWVDWATFQGVKPFPVVHILSTRPYLALQHFRPSILANHLPPLSTSHGENSASRGYRKPARRAK